MTRTQLKERLDVLAEKLTIARDVSEGRVATYEGLVAEEEEKEEDK